MLTHAPVIALISNASGVLRHYCLEFTSLEFWKYNCTMLLLFLCTTFTFSAQRNVKNKILNKQSYVCNERTKGKLKTNYMSLNRTLGKKILIISPEGTVVHSVLKKRYNVYVVFF